MNTINILIIEDEASQLEVYEDAIGQFNKKNEVKIVRRACKSFEEGEKALLSPSYDAAIIDLKLSTTEELEGIKLVSTVHKKIRIPIFIVSGSISQIDDIEESALLKKRLRTEKISNVLDEIYTIYKTGITSFLRPNGLIDQKLNEIFWNNLSSDLDNWIHQESPNSLLRYIVSHFHEALEIDVDGNFEEYHISEVYLAPPIKKHLHTGDIITVGSKLFIVLTPACDIVLNYKNDERGNKVPFRKSDKMVVAEVKEFVYDDLNKSKIKEYVTNSHYRFHYLPPFKNTSGYLIDFQELSTKAFDPNIIRIATISRPFIKDIISRFSMYYSRQGQPTFGQQNLIEDFDKKATEKRHLAKAK